MSLRGKNCTNTMPFRFSETPLLVSPVVCHLQVAAKLNSCKASAKLTAVIASYLSKAQYSRMLQPVHKYMVSSALMPDLIQVWLNLYSNGGTSCTYTDKNKHTHYLIIPEVRMYSANSQLGLGSASAHVANI